MNEFIYVIFIKLRSRSLFVSLGSGLMLIRLIVEDSDAFFTILAVIFIRLIFIIGMLTIGSLVSNLIFGFIVIRFMLNLFLTF